MSFIDGLPYGVIWTIDFEYGGQDGDRPDVRCLTAIELRAGRVLRLATCCGLRASEIRGLNLDDIKVNLERPCVRILQAVAKRRRKRTVPLWWDAGTLDGLRAWRLEREHKHGAGRTQRR